MTSAATRLSRVSIAAAAVAALLSGGPARAQVNAFIHFGNIKGESAAAPHGGQIEIESWSWGDSRAGYDLEPVRVTSWSTSGAGDSAPASGAKASRDIKMKGSKIGENARASRPGTAIGGAIGGWANDGSEAPAAARGAGANQMRMDDTAGKEKARRGTRTVDANEKITIHGGRTEGDPDRPVIIGSLPNPPSAPMQYNPKELTISKSNNWAARATPLPRGSVRVKTKLPWLACRVGTRYPALELVDGARRHRLEDVTVASCSTSGDADDRPTEEVAFYYNRIL